MKKADVIKTYVELLEELTSFSEEHMVSPYPEYTGT